MIQRKKLSMIDWIRRKYGDIILSLSILLMGSGDTKSDPLIRGRLLIQDAHEPEQDAKMPKGYKLVAITGILIVPATDERMANGQLNDVIGTLATQGDFPVLTLSILASSSIKEKTKGQDLGNSFNLDIWKF